MKFSAMDFIKHYSNLPIGPNLHVVKNHYVNLRGKAQESNTMDWDESVFVPARHQFFNLRKSNIPLYFSPSKGMYQIQMSDYSEKKVPDVSVLSSSEVEKVLVDLQGHDASGIEDPVCTSNAYGGLVYSAWLLQKITYRFSKGLIEQIKSTELNLKMPLELLLNLPHWCFYIDGDGEMFSSIVNDGEKFDDLRVCGYFIYADEMLFSNEAGVVEKHRCLAAIPSMACKVNGKDEMVGMVMPICIPIIPGGKVEDLLRYRPLKKQCSEEQLHRGTFDSFYGSSDLGLFAELFNALLWLLSCQENDTRVVQKSYRPGLPVLRKKRDWYIEEAKKDYVLIVGEKIGESLDRFMQEVKQIQMSETVRGVRTHVRSGHWRHQWRGSRKEGSRYVVPIWINPTLVRGSDAVGFIEETTI